MKYVIALALTLITAPSAFALSSQDEEIIKIQAMIDETRREIACIQGTPSCNAPLPNPNRVISKNQWPESCGTKPAWIDNMHPHIQEGIIHDICYRDYYTVGAGATSSYSSGKSSGGTVYVRAYTRSNGTHVGSYTRSAPRR